MTAAAHSAAMAAFLRGVERRAALLAEFQCGDPVAGDAALGAAMRAFGLSPGASLAEWPRRFWGLLLAAPQLRRIPAPTDYPPAWRPLAGLGNGVRAALLLRLAGGLEPEEIAAVLGTSPEQVRAALQRAQRSLAESKHTGDGGYWDELVQRSLRATSATRLAQLARLREQALAPVATPVPRPARRATTARAVGRRRIALWLVAGLCAATLGASFLRPDWFLAGPTEVDPRIRTEPLPPAQAPVARFDAGLRAWSHRDFELLADPAGLREAQRLPLLAWFAAQRAGQAAAPADVPAAAAPGVEATTVIASPPSTAALPANVEAAIARLPAPLQPALRASARRWHAWTPAEQAAYRQRQARWDAQLPSTRAEQRERYAAWRALDAASLRLLADAARAYAALPPEQQEGQRNNFAAQDFSTQRGWMLGPVLGADYAKLQPLLAQLPEAQHEATLRVLRALTPAERADLVVLAQRTPPQERAELLRALLSTSTDNRAAWLQARLAQ